MSGLESPRNQTNSAEDTVALQPLAWDANNAALVYTVTGLPPGLHLNANSGLVTGTLSIAAVSGSPYTVTYQVGDVSGTASLSFTWSVNAAGVVTLTNPGSQASGEGSSVSLSLSGSDSGGTLSYAAFGLPAGLSINPSTGAITGTVALGDAAFGSSAVTVVSNDGSHNAVQSFTWSVNTPIAFSQPDDQTTTEGTSVSLTLSALDAGGTLSYAALGLPPGLAINPSSGAITGTIAVGAAANGPYSVTLVAQDGTYTAVQTLTWNVSTPVTLTIPEDQSNAEGDTVSLALRGCLEIGLVRIIVGVGGYSRY